MTEYHKKRPMRIDEITSGSSLTGLEPSAVATVIAVIPIADGAVRVIYQTPDVFLFEDIPALDRRPDNVYLEEVDRCDLSIGLFGDSYGSEGLEGISPTEEEFDRATKAAKPRIIFVKSENASGRHPKMEALIRKAGDQLIRHRFATIPELTAGVYASLVEYLG